MKPFLLHQPAGRSDSVPGPLLAGELHGHEAYWRQIGDDVVQVSPLYAGARFFWCRTTSRPTRSRRCPTSCGRSCPIGWPSSSCRAPLLRGADHALSGARPRVRPDEVVWSYRVGDLADHLDRQRSDHRPGLVRHPLWQPQHLNEVHQLRPLDDPLGVIPPPHQAWLTANRAAFERPPARTLRRAP